MFLNPDYEDRAGRPAGDALCRAADHHVFQPRVAVRRRDDKIDIHLFRGLDNSVERNSHGDDRLGGQVEGDFPFSQFLEQFRRSIVPLRLMEADVAELLRIRRGTDNMKQDNARLELPRKRHRVPQCLHRHLRKIDGHENLAHLDHGRSRSGGCFVFAQFVEVLARSGRRNSR